MEDEILGEAHCGVNIHAEYFVHSRQCPELTIAFRWASLGNYDRRIMPGDAQTRAKLHRRSVLGKARNCATGLQPRFFMSITMTTMIHPISIVHTHPSLDIQNHVQAHTMLDRDSSLTIAALKVTVATPVHGID